MNFSKIIRTKIIIITIVTVCINFIFISSLFSAKIFYPQVPRIDAKTALMLVKSKKAILIDVHNSKRYKTKHVLEAINLPDTKIRKARRIRLPKNKLIILYCM